MGKSARFDAAVGRFVEDGGPGVAVAVLAGGEVVHRKAYGMADLEWGTRLSPDCSFRIASLTKQFTATAILRLEQQGRLSIDAPLDAHLADFDARGRRLTLRHLLNHTCGIRNHDDGRGPRTSRPTLARDQVLEEVKRAPFVSEPGERYQYCNSAYLLLGAVIEAVSGSPYEAFLAAEFFGPLGMRRTHLFDPDDIVPMRAHGYVRGRRGFHNARPDPLNWSHSAGNLCSTLDDLAIWDLALREGRVLDPAAFERMITPTRLADGEIYPYGFGWGTASYGGRALHHHTGGISGFACQMARLTYEPLTVIVLSNLYLFPFDAVTRGLLRVALDLPEPQSAERPAAPAELRACVGTFANRDGARVTVGQQGLDPAGLHALGEGRFCARADPEVEYRFSERRDGAYQRLEWVSPLWPVTRYERQSAGAFASP
jgi:CubicO group peptidase (beta-lactamase class C family)